MKNEFLFELLSQPTAPLREHHVVRTITEELRRTSVPYYFDAYGNIIVGVENEKAYSKRLQKKTSDPIRVLMAHLDHPGFHGLAWKKKNVLRAKWFGGGGPEAGLKGQKVWTADLGGWGPHGVISAYTQTPNPRGPRLTELEIKFTEEFHVEDATKIFGGYAFRAPVWTKGKNVYAKAIDDLVGVYAVIATVQKNKKNPALIGVLTRAEEVGLVGAGFHLDSSLYAKAGRGVWIVSLETSRTLPNAVIGKGPVIRTGDYSNPFDPNGVKITTELANKVLKGKFQRRLMDGGTCEASAAITFGFTAIGISIPLGNYHNKNYEGGPDAKVKLGPAPEFVSLEDIEGMLALCDAMASTKADWSDPWKTSRENYRANRKALDSFWLPIEV